MRTFAAIAAGSLAAAAAVLALAVAVGLVAPPFGSGQSARAAAGSGPGAVQISGVALSDQSLGTGRTRLRVRLTHTPVEGAAPAPAAARWFVRAPGTGGFRLAAVTRARELAPGVLAASAVVAPPAPSFSYRVCVEPAWAALLEQPLAPGSCPRGPIVPLSALRALIYQGRAQGVPAPPLPSPAAIAAASRYLDARAGRTAFAVMDSGGRMWGLRVHEHFESASVVKVMMLTAYLQRLAAHHLGLRARDTRLLYPMIHASDNDAASAVFARVGAGALARVAREAQMSDYAPGVGWWAFTQTSPIDQVRLFSMLDRLIPARFYGYARYLLSHIEPVHSWGIPPVARPRFEVFYKTGSLPSRGLFNEAARLERDGQTIAIAVFTDGEPSMGYGEQTVEGVAARLLGGDA